MNDLELARRLRANEQPLEPDDDVVARVEARMLEVFERATTCPPPATRKAAGEGDPVFVTPSRSAPPSQRSWMVIAAAVAALALVSGLLLMRSGGDRAPAAVPVPPPPSFHDEPQNVSSLPFPGARFGPGVYETGLLGEPLRFELGGERELVFARPGEFLLSHPGSTDTDFRIALFARLGGWSTREEAPDIGFLGVGSIDPYDIESWIAENDVIARRRPDIDVAGRSAEVYDVHVDPASENGFPGCPVEARPCFWYYSVSTVARPDPMRREVPSGPLGANATSRFYVVAIDGADPVFIEASASADHLDWLDEFETTILRSVELGAG